MDCRLLPKKLKTHNESKAANLLRNKFICYGLITVVVTNVSQTLGCLCILRRQVIAESLR
jgi:hypothetical protein